MRVLESLQKFSLWRFQKILNACLFAACVCLLALLAGCQNSDKKTGNQTTHLQLSTWGSIQELVVTRSLIKRFEENNPTIEVELLHIPENYFQKLHLLIAGGLTPDVMLVNSFSFPVYAQHGVFLDLAPYLQSRQIEQDDFYPQGLQAFQWHTQQPDNSPMQGAMPRDLSNLVVYVNTDLFKKQGVALPDKDWDWNAFLHAAKALTVDKDKNGSPEQFGISFYAKPSLFWMPFVWSAGGTMLSEGQDQLLLGEPKALEGLQFYTNLRNKWHVAPTKIETGNQNMSELFLKGRLAMMVNGRWSVPVLREQATFQWDVLPLPVGPSGLSRVGIDASGYAVAAQSKNREAAIRLVAFLTGKEAIQAVAESGLIVPARKTVATSDSFLNPLEKPQSAHVFLDVISDGVPTQSHPRWNELSELLQLALEPVWDNTVTPAEALKHVKPSVDKLLEEN